MDRTPSKAKRFESHDAFCSTFSKKVEREIQIILENVFQSKTWKRFKRNYE